MKKPRVSLQSVASKTSVRNRQQFYGAAKYSEVIEVGEFAEMGLFRVDHQYLKWQLKVTVSGLRTEGIKYCNTVESRGDQNFWNGGWLHG